MKASISFPEIQKALADKTQQSVSFAFVDPKTIRVTYPLNLGFMKKDVSANITVIDVAGSDLLLSFAAGFGTDKLLTTVLNLLRDKIPEGLIEKRPEGRIMLHLGQVEQMKSFFAKVEVNNIRVFDEGLEVEGTLK